MMTPTGSRRPAVKMAGMALLAAPALALMIGCHSLSLLSRDKQIEKSEPAPQVAANGRPARYSFRIAPYVFRSDFEINRDQPLFVELAQLRDQVQKELLLPPSSTQVDVFLFESRERYERYMKENYPELPPRRAFFVAQPRTIGGVEDLLVFTYWGDRIRQDLRHELTHALLHSVIKDVPLWLDEGLAEYFELPPENQGVNAGHLENLRKALTGPSRVNLARLEGLTKVEDMNPAEYRESWAWVHLMLRTKPEAKTALLSYLQQLRGHRHPGQLRAQLAKVFEDPELVLSEYLENLGRTPPPDQRAESPRPTARSVRPEK